MWVQLPGLQITAGNHSGETRLQSCYTLSQSASITTPGCRTDARMRNHVSGVGRDEEVDEDLFSGSGVVTD